MARFAKTAIIDYRLLFANQKTNVHFLSLFAANKWKFVVSVFRLQKRNESCCFPLVSFSICGNPETLRHGHEDMDTWTHGHVEMATLKHGDMEIENSNEKLKPRGFSFICLPLAIVQIEVCRLSVC